MDELIKTAMAELGEKEISGPEHNPTIVGYAKKAGFDWVNDDETPWCSIFVQYCAVQNNLKGTNKLTARSWLLAGKQTTNPEPGDIVVFWRENIDSWKGHVGFFLGFSNDGKRVYCLGGNQGNQVSITSYPTDKVLGYRRLVPKKEDLIVPDPTLKKGMTGNRVKNLQDSLKMAEFDCGTSDGDFGGKTESALKMLQTTGRLTIDGVYGGKSRDYLLSVLQE